MFLLAADILPAVTAMTHCVGFADDAFCSTPAAEYEPQAQRPTAFRRNSQVRAFNNDK